MAGKVVAADRGRRRDQRPRCRRQALIAYLDTSAFVKLLVAEPGSADASATWDAADRRASSLVLYPEARAAVARARRLERVSQRNYGRVRRRLEALWAVLDRVAVTPEVMRHAGALAETRALRAYDAVHLASAVAVADAELVFVASDGDLLAAARAHGLATSALG